MFRKRLKEVENNPSAYCSIQEALEYVRGKKEGIELAIEIYDKERGAELDYHLDGDGNCKHIETEPGRTFGPMVCKFCGEEV